MSKCIICGRELTSGESPEMYNNMCLKCYQEQNYAEYPFKQGVTDYQKQLKQSQTELAIQELEKFRAKLVNRFSPVELSYTEYVQKIFEELKRQIKALKGE